MRNLDRETSLFWLALSVVTCIGSLRLGIGRLQVPGMGFMPFVASVLLGILSLALFVQASLSEEDERREVFARKRWKQVVIIIIALSIYAWLVPILGYVIATFLFMGSIFKFAGVGKWWKAIVASFLTTFITFYLFSVLLGVQLPTGVLGL
jgi:putative tricarboxylic transport membrane protein